MEINMEEIVRALKRNRIEKFPTPNRTPLTHAEKMSFLQICIFGAFYPNYFVRRSESVDLKDVHKTLCGKDPMTTVLMRNFPKDQSHIGDLYAPEIKQVFKVKIEMSILYVYKTDKLIRKKISHLQILMLD